MYKDEPSNTCYMKPLFPNKAVISTNELPFFSTLNGITFVGYFGVTIIRNMHTVNLISLRDENTVRTEIWLSPLAAPFCRHIPITFLTNTKDAHFYITHNRTQRSLYDLKINGT